MRLTRWSLALFALALVAGSPALAIAPPTPTVEQNIALGDSVEGVILTASDTVALGFPAVKDTVLDVSIKAAKGSTLEPSIEIWGAESGLVDPGDALVDKGASVSVKKLVLPATDEYQVFIGSGTGTGEFSVKTKGKFPSKYTLAGNVPDSPAVEFDVQPGSVVKGQVKADKGSALEPVIASVEDKTGPLTIEDNTAKGSTAKFKSVTSEAGGTLVLTVGSSNETAGSFTAKLSVKAPKSKESYDLTGIADVTLVALPLSAAPGEGSWDNIPPLPVTVSTSAGKGSTGFTYANEYNMTGTKAGLDDFEVDVRAAYDAESLYVRLQWTDPSGTNDLNRRRWFFNGGDTAVEPDWDLQFLDAITANPLAIVEPVPVGWSSNLNDDKFAIAWAIGDPAGIKTDGVGNAAGLPADTTFAQAGCAVACHQARGMAPPTGLVDLWHWKSSRSNPLGFVNDQWGGDGTNRSTDTDQTIENRNRATDNFSGPTKVLNPEAANVTVDKGLGTATIAFAGTNGAINLDGRLFLTPESSMDIESTDAFGGQAIYVERCLGCHQADGRGQGKNLSNVGLTWTRAEIVAQVEAHAGITLDEPTTVQDKYSTADTNKLVARIRAFAGAPGYWLADPASVADTVKVVNFLNVYDPGTGQYTVIVERKLTTADAGQDVQFDDLSKAYLFGLAVMDFDGQNHAGNPLLRLVFQPQTP